MGFRLNIRSSAHLSLSLFQDGQGNTVLLWEGNQWLLSCSDDEYIFLSGGEGLSVAVLDVDDIISSNVSFDVLDLANSTNIVSSSQESSVSSVVLDPFKDFTVVNVVFDCVSDFNLRMGESDSSSIMSHNIGDLVGTESLGLNL